MKEKLEPVIGLLPKKFRSRARVFVFGKKKRWRVARFLSVFFLVIAVFSYSTNPFVKYTLVKDDYLRVVQEDDVFRIEHVDDLVLKDDAFFRSLAYLKSGWHIFTNKVGFSRLPKTFTVDDIISEIHEKRFNPDHAYLISGDHFSVFYPRSLGIFYNSMLDPRTALNSEDWENRQHIYLKSLLFALRSYSQGDRLSTTIVPVGPRSVSLVNIYAYPSDTLYSLLYALITLRDSSTLQELYPYGDAEISYELQTHQAVETVLDEYSEELARHVDLYVEKVVDVETGLIQKDLLLSSTKDIVKRSSSFYDNVVLWRTLQMADELGVTEYTPEFLDDLRQKILDTYWIEDEGYFLDHLSDWSVENKAYSSDWIIVQMTGFLDPNNEEDLDKIVRSVDYIQRNAIDQPFGLQYQPDYRRHEMHWVPGTFAPTYGSTAIWSNWGIEYVKLLTRLYQVTRDVVYLEKASRQLDAYTFNIKRYRGFPEVYTSEGDFFKSRLYQSVRQTGWVVNYEQAREMVEWERAQVRENTTSR